LPNEEVQVEILEEKKDFARAKLLHILSSHLERVSPRCRHFGECGGCQFQHISYDEQVQIKSRWLLEWVMQLQKENLIWEEPQVADKPWEYRSRIQLHANGEGGWGFYKRRSNEVIRISECPITDSRIISMLQEVPQKAKHLTQKVELTWNETENKLEFSQDEEFYSRSFQQIFRSQNEVLIQDIGKWLAMIEWSASDLIWALFAGDGNLTLPLAKMGFLIAQVEINSSSQGKSKVDAKKQNIIDQIRFFQENVDQFLQKFLAGKVEISHPKVIIVDPPRTGLKTSVESLMKLYKIKPFHLLYVSCEMSHLRRDLQLLIQAGMRINRVKWYDFFPQTYHFETLVHLS